MQLQVNLSKEELRKSAIRWAVHRERGRTDLFFLANDILSPADSRIMVPHAHGCIVNHCQTFKGRRENIDFSGERISKYGTPMVYESTERVPMWDLEGERDRLLLVSRGHLKTTIHTVAHCIQWILNYPDVRILIATATEEKARLIVSKIKQHFQFNPFFRALYPEWCPDAKKVSDWGSSTELRIQTPYNKKRGGDEPTIMTASVGKALASTHHDVIKCSDVVTENNVRTPGQIAEVKEFFGYMEPLRERGPSKGGRPNPGWKDVEGTIYDFSDYYTMILDHQESQPPEKRNWKITKQSCWVDREKRVALWPEVFPPAELDRIAESPEVGPVLFASQYELDPIRGEDGLAKPDQVKFFPAHLVNELMPRYRIHTTVDCAGMDPQTDGDSWVFTTAGFDRDGRMDVLSILKKRFTLDEVVNLFFAIQKVYPSNIDFKVQKDHFARVLEPIIRREMGKRNVWLNVQLIPISTRISKQQRIRGLQAWFLQGLIRFADNISCRNDLMLEILRFPKFAHDDILDTLADQMQNREGVNTDVIPDAPRWQDPGPQFNPFLGFDPITKEERWFRDQVEGASSMYHDVTGI